jgi:phosphoglycolate phosphatase-like HAD superfamily hydrolase
MRLSTGQIKAIVFDFDGVILESADIKTEAFLELFADHPQHQPAILQYHLEHLGVSRYDKFDWIYRDLLNRPYTPVDRQRLGSEFSALVMEKILACPYVPGALESLAALKDNYPLFVASGTPQEELDIVVTRRGLGGYFAEVWGTPRKKPGIIRDILVRYDWEPAEVLMVGDGLSDYRAAVETGVPFLARVTPSLAEEWAELDVAQLSDLRNLGQFVETPRPGTERKERSSTS